MFHGKSRTPFLYVTLIFYTLFHFFSIVDVINYRKKLQDTGGLDGREKKQKKKKKMSYKKRIAIIVIALLAAITLLIAYLFLATAERMKKRMPC